MKPHAQHRSIQFRAASRPRAAFNERRLSSQYRQLQDIVCHSWKSRKKNQNELCTNIIRSSDLKDGSAIRPSSVRISWWNCAVSNMPHSLDTWHLAASGRSLVSWKHLKTWLFVPLAFFSTHAADFCDLLNWTHDMLVDCLVYQLDSQLNRNVCSHSVLTFTSLNFEISQYLGSIGSKFNSGVCTSDVTIKEGV